MIKFVDGDLLDAKDDIIAHQTNCLGVMGGGVALQIKQKYPSIYQQYKFDCEVTKNKKNLLGRCFIYNSENVKIANLFGQFDFGTQERKTNYIALRNAFEELDRQLCFIEPRKKMTVALPYNMGCGLGGGNWDIVYNIIEETLKDRDVVIYRYAE